MKKLIIFTFMQIERTSDEILIRLPADVDIVGLQRILDYLNFREIASKSKAKESKTSWWTKNKSRLIK